MTNQEVFFLYKNLKNFKKRKNYYFFKFKRGSIVIHKKLFLKMSNSKKNKKRFYDLAVAYSDLIDIIY